MNGLSLRSSSAQTPALIELKLGTVNRLFHALDPSPFTEKDLDREAEEFILGWAREQPPDRALELLIYLDAPIEPGLEARVQDAIQNYFKYERDATARKLHRLINQGWLSLLIGLTFLALCLGAADLLQRRGDGPIFQIGNYSFIIAGWVAMSRPLEIFLYEWWPIRHERRIFERLMKLKVEICYGAPTADAGIKIGAKRLAPHDRERTLKTLFGTEVGKSCRIR